MFRRKNYINYVSFIFVICSGCVQQNNAIREIPITTYYNNCDAIIDFGVIITIGDPSDKFMISLPYSWDIQESYFDTLFGIFASNIFETGNDPKKLQSISITGYSTNDSLKVYVEKELTSLKKDTSISVNEMGKTTINDRNGYWVLFENNFKDGDIVNLVVFIKREKSNEIYLIQSSVYKTENFRERICRLKQLVNTFEIVEN
ncbi:MAG: hypothetical protein H8D45_32525 [Bacteroidetes bacterium]|nr:hypothetical protein [Bacteroidota bacterium]MBL7103113.1 hypothetical protein [Bacteroidales bacterium]